ncbi:MAG: hypothetical protein EOO73_14530 [Myxococcales bacterium]|nr:MAG: hypothetical protein EOO73_14530 [Myxococcales bacterium]
MRALAIALFATTALLGACSDDDDDGSGNNGGTSGGGSSPTAGQKADGGAAGQMGNNEAGETAAGAGGTNGAAARKFTVTLENVAPVKLFTSSGVFNTPTGDAAPGPATPGKSYEFTIHAGRKQKLSFATMLAATNDLFYAPNGDGIALYDEDGEPLSGDVTDQVYLWDAGTEVNEEPKVGPNTVSKQAAPNTGPVEGGNVQLIEDTEDTFEYPAVSEVLSVEVMHVSGTEFKVMISNVSTDTALHTSDGDFAAPISPGTWVVHGGANPLFTPGMPDRSQGIESIAEDGNPSTLGAFAAATSGVTFPASPGVWAVHAAGEMPLFVNGDADFGDGLEHIAEDGNPALLGEELATVDALSAAVFNMPVGSATPGPITPGKKYQFSFEAAPGQSLSFATMLAATNDVFFGPADVGIPLFDEDGEPIDGDITGEVLLWDTGTEANEEPAIGPNTVTNQPAPDTGEAGEGKVQPLSEVDDSYSYPAVDELLKVTISVE